MRKPLLLGVGALAATCLIWNGSIRESESAPLPENTLLGIRLGRSYMDVLRLYGGPNQILTVAVPGGSGGSMMPGGDMGMPGGVFGGGSGGPAAGSGPGLPPPPGFGGSGGAFPGMAGSGGAFPGMAGSGGAFPGMPGGAGMAGPLGRRGAMMGSGGGMMGSGGGGSPFGPPVLPPTGGEGMAPGMPGMMPGMPGGMMGSPGGLASPGAEGSPEVSSALLWIYNKGNTRLEFLINEDGRVAQISVAAPAKSLTRTVSSLRGQVPVKTGRGITLGSNYARVVQAYGFPEKTRLIMGGRFDESYFTKNYHAAFTVDGQSQRKVVRITITLAD